jgi:hypothetical protein
MTGHRQEMLNVTLSVGEIQEAIERRIMEKYKFLTGEDGWDLQDLHYHKDNLHDVDQNKQGATIFFVREIPVAEDAAPLKEACGGVCTKCLNSCR